MAKDDAPPPPAALADLPFELQLEEPKPQTGREFPKDVYYQQNFLYKDVSNRTIEELVPAYLRPDVFADLSKIAGGRNVPVLAMLRQGIYVAFENGGFECSQPVPELEGEPNKLKRTGNDDNNSHIDNIRLRAMLGETNFGILQAHAKPAKLSNVAALNRGLRFALDAEKV